MDLFPEKLGVTHGDELFYLFNAQVGQMKKTPIIILPFSHSYGGIEQQRQIFILPTNFRLFKAKVRTSVACIFLVRFWAKIVFLEKKIEKSVKKVFSNNSFETGTFLMSKFDVESISLFCTNPHKFFRRSGKQSLFLFFPPSRSSPSTRSRTLLTPPPPATWSSCGQTSHRPWGTQRRARSRVKSGSREY